MCSTLESMGSEKTKCGLVCHEPRDPSVRGAGTTRARSDRFLTILLSVDAVSMSLLLIRLSLRLQP